MQAVALSGLFQAMNVGGIVGLAVSSAVLQLTLKSELDTKLEGFPKKDKVGNRKSGNSSFELTLL